MPDPTELLLVARQLSQSKHAQAPTDAQLRRAVSTAYYALFHTILRAAADRFIGAELHQSPAYALIYRAFDHTKMKTVFEDINKATLSEKYRQALRRDTVSQHMRDVATYFPVLQSQRHLADYHPTSTFRQSSVASLIDATLVAIIAFNSTTLDERADVLALLMVGVRR